MASREMRTKWKVTRIIPRSRGVVYSIMVNIDVYIVELIMPARFGDIFCIYMLLTRFSLLYDRARLY